MSENCNSLVLQDKCNIEIFMSPGNQALFFVHWEEKGLKSNLNNNINSHNRIAFYVQLNIKTRTL